MNAAAGGTIGGGLNEGDGVQGVRQMRESRESQKTRESQELQNSQGTQPKIGRIPALIAAVVIVGGALGGHMHRSADVDAVRRRASYARLC